MSRCSATRGCGSAAASGNGSASRARSTRDPAVLVLDEVTNALDAVTERRVIDGLLALRPRRTIIFVSHKASVARRASRIVIIQDGVAMADGPYRELVFDERFRELLTDVEERDSAPSVSAAAEIGDGIRRAREIVQLERQAAVEHGVVRSSESAR